MIEETRKGYCILMNSKQTHLKVAHGHPGEVSTFLPLNSPEDVLENAPSPERVLCSQECVHDQELADHVEDVKKLHEEVESSDPHSVQLPVEQGSNVAL